MCLQIGVQAPPVHPSASIPSPSHNSALTLKAVFSAILSIPSFATISAISCLHALSTYALCKIMVLTEVYPLAAAK